MVDFFGKSINSILTEIISICLEFNAQRNNVRSFPSPCRLLKNNEEFLAKLLCHNWQLPIWSFRTKLQLKNFWTTSTKTLRFVQNTRKCLDSEKNENANCCLLVIWNVTLSNQTKKLSQAISYRNDSRLITCDNKNLATRCTLRSRWGTL